MTLEEAYIRRKQENMALKRENASLSATVEALRKGTYSNPEKIAHLKKISELTRKLKEQERIKERYKTLYEKEKDGVNEFQALLRLTQNKPYTLQELCSAGC